MFIRPDTNLDFFIGCICVYTLACVRRGVSYYTEVMMCFFFFVRSHEAAVDPVYTDDVCVSVKNSFSLHYHIKRERIYTYLYIGRDLVELQIFPGEDFSQNPAEL